MPESSWTPGVDDVGSILRARTKDTSGNELGTFTPETRPTADQVTSLIAQAAGDVTGAISKDPADMPTKAHGPFKSVATVGAAMLVELSYFPEQVATGRSPYDQLAELYATRLGRLRGLLGLDGDGTTGPTSAPSFAFPMKGDPELIGRRTQW